MSTTTVTTEDILASVAQLPDAAKRKVAIGLLQQFNSQAILELLRQIKPADTKEPDYELPEPVTDEEKEAYAFAKALGLNLEHDDNPGVQALNRLGAALREAGVTYDDLMAQIKIEQEKTIRQHFPSLIPLLDETSPDAKTVS